MSIILFNRKFIIIAVCLSQVEKKGFVMPQNAASRSGRKNSLVQLKNHIRRVSRDLPRSEQIKLEGYRRDLMLEGEEST